MNNRETPLKGMIKLLGRGRGLISQAFFVESLLPHFKEDGIWEDILRDYKSGGKQYEILTVFLEAYFEVIKNIFINYWPEIMSPWHYKKPLCKTNGMGALFRLINDIYPEVSNLKDKEEMKKKISSFFKKIDKETADKLFSETSEYARSGSVGLQRRLYKTLLDLIM